MVYLSYVIDSVNEEVDLTKIPIVKKSLDIFQIELPRLSLDKQVKVPIDVILGTSSITQLSYRMTWVKMVELNIQLRENSLYNPWETF